MHLTSGILKVKSMLCTLWLMFALLPCEALDLASKCGKSYANTTLNSLVQTVSGALVGSLPKDSCIGLLSNSLNSTLFVKSGLDLLMADSSSPNAPVLDTNFSVGVLQPAPGAVINITGVVLERVLLFPPSSFSSCMLMPWVHRYPSSGAKLYLTNVTLVTLCGSLQQYSQAVSVNNTLLGQTLTPGAVIEGSNSLHITSLATNLTSLVDVTIRCNPAYTGQFNNSVPQRIYIPDGYSARQAIATFADLPLAGEMLLTHNISLDEAPDVTPRIFVTRDILIQPDEPVLNSGQICAFSFGAPWANPLATDAVITFQSLHMIGAHSIMQGPEPDVLSFSIPRFEKLNILTSKPVIASVNCSQYYNDPAFQAWTWYMLTMFCPSSRVAAPAERLMFIFGGMRVRLLDDNTFRASSVPDDPRVIVSNTGYSALFKSVVPPGLPPVASDELMYAARSVARPDYTAPALMLAKSSRSLAAALQSFHSAAATKQPVQQTAEMRLYKVKLTPAGWPLAIILYNDTISYNLTSWAQGAPANSSGPATASAPVPSAKVVALSTSCMPVESELIIQGDPFRWATLDLSVTDISAHPCLFRPTGQAGKLKLRNMVLLLGPDVPPPTTSEASADTWLPQSLTLSQLTGLESGGSSSPITPVVELDAMKISVSQDVFQAVRAAALFNRNAEESDDAKCRQMARTIITSTAAAGSTLVAWGNDFVELENMDCFGWSARSVTFVPGPHPGSWETRVQVPTDEPKDSKLGVKVGVPVACGCALALAVAALVWWRHSRRDQQKGGKPAATVVVNIIATTDGTGVNRAKVSSGMLGTSVTLSALDGYATGSLGGQRISDVLARALAAVKTAGSQSQQNGPLTDFQHLVVFADKQRGCGSAGLVVEGTYKGLPCAVKVLQYLMNGPHTEDHVKSFQQEVKILSNIDHPNVVRLYASSLEPPNICLVQELLKYSLAELIHGNGDASGEKSLLPLPRVLQLSRDIALGLAHLHPTVIHRDLKPQNILIDVHGLAKIADFGLARVKMASHHVTEFPLAGTPGYLAPECMEGTGALSEQVDIFALGVIMWEMVTGERPWNANCPMALLTPDQCGRNLVLPAEGDPRCPPGLRCVIQSCLQQQPQLRPGAGEVVATLSLFMATPEARD